VSVRGGVIGGFLGAIIVTVIAEWFLWTGSDTTAPSRAFSLSRSYRGTLSSEAGSCASPP